MVRFAFPFVVLAAVLSSTTRADDPNATAPAPPSEVVSNVAAVQKKPAATTAALGAGRRLRQHSHDAFRRGLMPLSDHLEHLSAAEETEVRWVTQQSAQGQPSATTLRPALQPRIDAIRQAVRQMEAFRQPAAANWEAELLLGKYVLAQAEEEAALLAGDQPAASIAAKSQAKWAQAHYARRVFDARVLGHASLPEVTQAITFLNISSSAKQRALQAAIEQSQTWNRAQSGIGRADRVLSADLQLSLWNLEATSQQGNRGLWQKQVRDADDTSARLFIQQKNYFRHGTATLNDLARAWQTRRQVHLFAQWNGIALPSKSPPALDQSLSELSQIASTVADHRGRHAADVEYVRVLETMHIGDDAERTERSQKPTGDSAAVTPAGHRQGR